MTSQTYTASIQKQQVTFSRTESIGLLLYDLLAKHSAVNSNFTPYCVHVQKRQPLTIRYQVMLKSLVTDTINDIVWKVCPYKIIARVCKDTNTSWPYMSSPWKDFCPFISPTLLWLLRVLTTGFKLRSFLTLVYQIARSFLTAMAAWGVGDVAHRKGRHKFNGWHRGIQSVVCWHTISISGRSLVVHELTSVRCMCHLIWYNHCIKS
jgi:hypothetical protein